MIHHASLTTRAGSLTPQLEGAAHSTPHPARTQPVKPSPQAKKGGVSHE